MPDTQTTDLVVLGGGPGGYAAAFLAADRGVATTLIDAAPKPGGTCLHVGCIPSKTLLHVAEIIHAARDAADFGLKFAPPQIDLKQLHAKADKVVDLMSSSLLDGCKKRGITHVVGRGTFVDANTIQVSPPSPSGRGAGGEGGGRERQVQALHPRRRLDPREAARVRHRQQAHPRFDRGLEDRERAEIAAR